MFCVFRGLNNSSVILSIQSILGAELHQLSMTRIPELILLNLDHLIWWLQHHAVFDIGPREMGVQDIHHQIGDVIEFGFTL